MTNKILCDTDFLVALLLNQDSNNSKANSLFDTYSVNSEFLVLNKVYITFNYSYNFQQVFF